MNSIFARTRVSHAISGTLNDKHRVSHGFLKRVTCFALCQALLVQPLLIWHPSAVAQDSGDGGEGADPCAPPKDNGEDDEAEDEDEPSDEAPDDDSEASPDSDNADPGNDDGGDYGDGGSAVGDPSGTDGNGTDQDGSSFDDVGGGGGGGGGSFGGGHLDEVSDPINLRMADKAHVQVDYLGRGAGPLRWARVYHSNSANYAAQVTMPMGAGWRSYYDRSLQVISSSQIRLHRANGRTMDFTFNGSAWTSALPAGVLSTIAGGWQYVNHRNQVERYGSNGRLLSLASGALVTSMGYDAGWRLVQVASPSGRTIAIGYDGANRVSTVTLPGGSSLTYNYDARSNLSGVRFADNSLRQYAYENSSFPNALTGVIDESGRRRLTWGYDAQGRPNYGHYGAGVNSVSIAYGNGTVVTTDARGTQRTRTYGVVGQRLVMTSLQTSATADSAATAWSFAYDGNGNLASASTRTGEVRQFSNDSRARTLSATRAAGTPIARQTQATWHATFRKPIQIIKAGVTRNLAIDGYGRVTQITQTSGGTTVTMLTRTYNAQGLVQSITNSRGATKTFAYDASGNVTSISDALGQVTYFQNFDAHGRPTRVVRSNGTVVERTFDSRSRLTSKTVAGRSTSYSYDPAGRLVGVTRPDGSWSTRSFDSAGLLASKSNDRGQMIVMGRDATARVVSRNVYTASGSLALTSSRQYNSRSLLSSVTDSRSYRTQLTYGSDGRASGLIDPIGRAVNRQLDLLDRSLVTTQPNTTAMRQAGGPATVSTTFSFHASTGTHLSTTDTNTVVTGYGYDAFNRRTAEAGADAGGIASTRNGAGDIQSITDPRGVTLTLTRDALGRVTAVVPPSSGARQYSYVAGRTDSLLAGMSDPSGSTTWTYDTVGRLLSKTQVVAGVSRKLTVTRDAIGRVSSMTYPSGMRLDVSYSGEQVSSLAVNGSTLLNNISYLPFSPTATGWRWGNGSQHNRTFDADGRVTSVSLGSVQRNYSYDAAGRVTSFSDQSASGSTVSSFGYDEAGQLITYSGPAGTFTFNYDANGNRRSTVRNGVQESISYAPGSNRMINSPRGSYTYNADGSPSSDGWLNYEYDDYGRLATMSINDDKNQRSYNGQGMRVRSLTSYFRSTDAGTRPGDTRKDALQRLTTTRDLSPRFARGPRTNAGNWVTMSDYHYFHVDDGSLLGEYDTKSGTKRETIWFNGQPVAALIGATLYIVRSDHLNTPRSISRASDNVEVWRWDSDPFGNSTPTGSITYNLRFPGQQYDNYTGYYYNWMRDYDPWTGRYIQADPVGLSGGLARYTYVGGNPLSHVDPRGLDDANPFGPLIPPGGAPSDPSQCSPTKPPPTRAACELTCNVEYAPICLFLSGGTTALSRGNWRGGAAVGAACSLMKYRMCVNECLGN